MSVWHLFRKELAFRKGTAFLGLLSVLAAMVAWVGAVSLMRAHDLRTEQILIERERATRAEMQRLEDDYRRIMRDLGYNMLILPGDQNPSAMRAQGHPDTTMPFEYVERLAQGGIETLNHLLPVLQQGVEWPENGSRIILSGTPGQIPITHLTQFLTPDGKAYRNPIMETIPAGEAILGHSIAAAHGISEGDTVTLFGDTFKVLRINPMEGTTDDIAVWTHLDWVQERLDLPDRINLILALDCVCTADSLSIITAEVQAIVPDVQVLEFSSQVRARALARNRAEEAARTAIQAEQDHRAEVAAAQQRFASTLAPLVIGGAAVWMFFLFLGNVRERRVEIGILRAIGIRERTILSAFLLKSASFGLAGALLGFFIGHALAAAWAGVPVLSSDFANLLDYRLLVAALLLAPAFCILAAWCAAVPAIRRDPARILCEA